MWKILRGSSGKTVRDGFNTRHHARQIAEIMTAGDEEDDYYTKYYEEEENVRDIIGKGNRHPKVRRKHIHRK